MPRALWMTSPRSPRASPPSPSRSLRRLRRALGRYRGAGVSRRLPAPRRSCGGRRAGGASGGTAGVGAERSNRGCAAPAGPWRGGRGDRAAWWCAPSILRDRCSTAVHRAAMRAARTGARVGESQSVRCDVDAPALKDRCFGEVCGRRCHQTLQPVDGVGEREQLPRQLRHDGARIGLGRRQRVRGRAIVRHGGDRPAKCLGLWG